MSQPSRAETIQSHFHQSKTAGTPLPPILTSLNGDNSWLISFPRPESDRTRPGSKSYFHVVFDPWLAGEAILTFRWLARVTLSINPAILSGEAVEAVAREIEEAAAVAPDSPSIQPSHNGSPPSAIDAIFVNFHYLDHLHENTLRTFRPDIPVFAAPEAAAMIRPWNYFHKLTETRDFDSSHADS